MRYTQIVKGARQWTKEGLDCVLKDPQPENLVRALREAHFVELTNTPHPFKSYSLNDIVLWYSVDLEIFHIMGRVPSKELPFKDIDQLWGWVRDYYLMKPPTALDP
jgi:hypothetical protein